MRRIKMEKDFFFKIADKVKCRIIEGVTHEIQVFFDSYVDDITNIITTFKFDRESTIKNNRYKILIEVKKLDTVEIKKIFLSFLTFVSYAYFAAYNQSVDKTNHIVRYLFITSNSNDNGFCCELVFREG